MSYNYGEIFKRLGIPAMGHQGATWCALDPQGVLVLVAHQNFVHKRDGRWQYEVPNEGQHPQRAPSAIRSIQMLSDYFTPNKDILLAVAEFFTDGGPRPDGTWEASQFKHATGSVYRARMIRFDPPSGHLLCDIDSKFEV